MNQPIFNVLLIGDEGVGRKTIYQKLMVVNPNKHFKYHLTDNGQVVFDAIWLVMDASLQNTEKIKSLQQWKDYFNHNMRLYNIPKIVIWNKSDKKIPQRASQAIKDLVANIKSSNTKEFYISTLTGWGLKKAIEAVIPSKVVSNYYTNKTNVDDIIDHMAHMIEVLSVLQEEGWAMKYNICNTAYVFYKKEAVGIDLSMY